MPSTFGARTTTEPVSLPRDSAVLGPLVHPGEMLLEQFLRLSAVASRGSRQAKVDPLGLQQSIVADELGISRNHLNELVLGERSVTADTAIRLERRFKMPARFWLHLQTDYELQTALTEDGRASTRESYGRDLDMPRLASPTGSRQLYAAAGGLYLQAA